MISKVNQLCVCFPAALISAHERSLICMDPEVGLKVLFCCQDSLAAWKITWETILISLPVNGQLLCPEVEFQSYPKERFRFRVTLFDCAFSNVEPLDS